MPLHGQRDLPVNPGMFVGMERWGGETGEELKLSTGGSTRKGWGLAGGAGWDCPKRSSPPFSLCL